MAIPHNRPLLLAEDREAVDRVLRSGWIGHGPEGKALESDFASYLGGGRACAVSSGSSALFLALDTLRIGRGHRVAIPTYSCTALLNAVHSVGAEAIPVDLAPGSFNISAATLSQAAEGKPFDAVIAVHTYGEPADMTSLRPRARYVIEDACQAIGGFFGGHPLGRAGDLAVFSFYATKPITSGHGGLLYDPSGTIIERAFDYREFDAPKTYRPRSNIQLSDIQAGLARSQFTRIDKIAKRRREVVARYLEVTPAGLQPWPRSVDETVMPYRFVLTAADEAQLHKLRDVFTDAGITTINPFEPREQLHRYLGLDPTAYPQSEALCAKTLSVPLYPGLTDDEVGRIVTVLKRLPN